MTKRAKCYVKNYMQEHKPNSTQQTKILEALEKSNGEWINGRFFNDTPYITQFHSRIHELQKKGISNRNKYIQG